MKWTPPVSAGVGAGIGAAIATFAVGAELRATGLGLLELHLGSVTVWVVDSLPLMFAIAGYGIGDRQVVRGPEKVRVLEATPAPAQPRRDLPPPAPRALPAPPPLRPPTPPPPATPAGVTRTVAPTVSAPAFAGRTATPASVPGRLRPAAPLQVPPSLRNIAVLYVDGHMEGPSVAAALEAAGVELHHVRDALSGAVVAEGTRLAAAVVDSADPDGAALVGELQADGVVTVAVGARAAGPCVLRPLEPQRVVDALADALAVGT